MCCERVVVALDGLAGGFDRLASAWMLFTVSGVMTLVLFLFFCRPLALLLTSDRSKRNILHAVIAPLEHRAGVAADVSIVATVLANLAVLQTACGSGISGDDCVAFDRLWSQPGGSKVHHGVLRVHVIWVSLGANRDSTSGIRCVR